MANTVSLKEWMGTGSLKNVNFPSDIYDRKPTELPKSNKRLVDPLRQVLINSQACEPLEVFGNCLRKVGVKDGDEIIVPTDDKPPKIGDFVVYRPEPETIRNTGGRPYALGVLGKSFEVFGETHHFVHMDETGAHSNFDVVKSPIDMARVEIRAHDPNRLIAHRGERLAFIC